MPDPAPRLTRNDIARRVARDLPDGAVVNLGIGIPALCANFVPPGTEVRYMAENGILGFGEHHPDGEGDPDVMDAGGKFPRRVPGMAFFDSAAAFAMIRGGHIDVTVLGGLQVSRHGDLSNWMIPSRGIGSIGGAMDLAANTKRVIVAMEHTAKPSRPATPPAKAPASRPGVPHLAGLLPNGEAAKVVDECDYPLTARRCVSMIVTDIAVIDVLPEGRGLLLREVAPGWDSASVQALTATQLQVPATPRLMTFS
jgi:3-oxoacid CoA-transferase subunit B